MHTPAKRWLLAPLAAFLLVPATASATITPVHNGPGEAAGLATAIATDPSVINAGTTTFSAIAPAGDPVALSTTPLATFPRNGDSYAILSTGDAKLAANANENSNDGANLDYEPPVSPARGGGAHDPVTLNVGLNVPVGVNCMVLRFRFLSDEYPEFVSSGVNDAFVAELDQTTWSTNEAGSTVTAPDNFAFDEKGNPITIDATGAATASDVAALGTIYDGATRRLAAAKSISPGAHTLYLSIFDQGDHIYDSAAFLDDLSFINVDPSKCTSGVFQDDAPPAISSGGSTTAPEAVVSNGQFTKDDTPTFGGKGGTTLNDDPKVTGSIYASTRATPVSGTAIQTKTVGLAPDGSWSVTADALPEGKYVFQASQGSTNGPAVTDPITFSVDKSGPKPAVAAIGYSRKTRDTTPLITGTAGAGPGDTPALSVKVFKGKTATGTALQTLGAATTGGAWSAQLAKLKTGTYTLLVEQGDAAGNAGSATATFAVTTSNPIGKVKLKKSLSSTAAAKGLAGKLKFAFPGKVTFALSAKVGKKTTKLKSVTRKLKKPATAKFSLKPKKGAAAKLRGRQGTLILKTSFVDDQGRKYSRTQKVRFK